MVFQIGRVFMVEIKFPTWINVIRVCCFTLVSHAFSLKTRKWKEVGTRLNFNTRYWCRCCFVHLVLHVLSETGSETEMIFTSANHKILCWHETPQNAFWEFLWKIYFFLIFEIFIYNSKTETGKISVSFECSTERKMKFQVL